jgi:hypothetical protein
LRRAAVSPRVWHDLAGVMATIGDLILIALILGAIR